MSEPREGSGSGQLPVLEARGIRKSFVLGSQEIRVLRGVDLSLRRGEIAVILGASGVGKSTLLHILGTLERPDGGQVLFDGEDVAVWTETRRARFRNTTIGFVFQFHHLLPELTALENVMVPGLIAGSRPSELEAKAVDLLDEVGLGNRRHHRPVELSGGEQQRVAVARALYWDPPVVLADEPTGNLDPETGEKIHQLIYTLAKRRKQSWLMVTHNENLSRLADRKSRLVSGVLQGGVGDGSVPTEAGTAAGGVEARDRVGQSRKGR